jgi:uncharacterized LabA/DUF88 family protein
VGTKQNNYVFIDSQNVYKGIKSLGWMLDWYRFRAYLREKYSVTTAYLFIGFMPEHNDIYDDLQNSGFVLKFKPVLPDRDGGVKRNVDADLVFQAMLDHGAYDHAVLISSDGDFYSLVRYLYDTKKLRVVMNPYVKTCSRLLKKSAKEKIVFRGNLESKIGKKKSTA